MMAKAPTQPGEATTQRLTQIIELTRPVSSLQYVSATRLKGLNRLGIFTLSDLLHNYPFRYNDFSDIASIAATPIGARSSILGSVHEVNTKHIRARLTIVEVTLTDDTGTCLLSFFNQPWLARQIKPGMTLICNGTVEHYRGYRQMSSPLFTVLEDEDAPGQQLPLEIAANAHGEKTAEQASRQTTSRLSIQPVYHANSDISQGWIRRLINDVLDASQGLPDPLPAELRLRYNLVSRGVAALQVHRPSSMDDCRAARRRLAFDEIFMLQLYLLQRKARIAAGSHARLLVTDGPAMSALPAVLPFTLTDDQVAAVSDILADLGREAPMTRLLMGDVGSGKTVVALHALVAAADSNAQAAMMAPTEVLAVQYATQLGPCLDRLNIRWALLTSSTSPAERAGLLTGLSTNEIKIVFGTHALIEPDVLFDNLALVVIDEQHRFGVEQREALRRKGAAVHQLTMTATPIPRSQALTIYGDQDVSEIRSRPRQDVKIVTKVLDRSVIGQAYDAVREALRRGEQAYIVCPLIGQPAASSAADDDTDEVATTAAAEYLTEYSEPGENLTAATRERDFLAYSVFPEYTVGLMTSRLPGAEKRRVMDDFRAGRIDVLVSTTVIEVGVDVPNATVMVIQDADRFGLSQLHQLRGRVGRGTRDGEAFLISSTGSDEARERLKAMEQSVDGFELAEVDLRLRQEGDILGLRQHGQATFRLVQVIRDREMIEAAHREARRLLSDDAELEKPEHALLVWELRQLTALWEQD